MWGHVCSSKSVKGTKPHPPAPPAAHPLVSTMSTSYPSETALSAALATTEGGRSSESNGTTMSAPDRSAHSVSCSTAAALNNGSKNGSENRTVIRMVSAAPRIAQEQATAYITKNGPSNSSVGSEWFRERLHEKKTRTVPRSFQRVQELCKYGSRII